jgi:hypothetical protein
MTTLELTRAQARVLRTTMKTILSDLSVEIAGTDKKSYREEIKAERAILQEIMSRLEAAAESAA